MGKSKKSKTSKESTTLDIENITQLGGNKKDFGLLEEVEDDGEAIDFVEDLEAEPIKKDEIRDFIKQLGFDDIMEVVEEEDSFKTTANSEKDFAGEEKNTKTKKKQITSANKKDEEQGEVTEKKAKKKRNKYKIQDEEISSTTAELDLSFIQDYHTRNYLLIKSGGKWFDHQTPSDVTTEVSLVEHKVTSLLDHAKMLYQEEVSVYKAQLAASKKSDITWIQTVLKSGTVSDKMAALTLLIQEAPVHNLSGLDNLVTTVKKKGRREALLAIDTLKELFLTELLLDNRKLKSFDQQPLAKLAELASGSKDSRDKRLIMWYYEGQLREKYAEFVHALEVLCHDNILAAKLKSLVAVFELLAGKPEQEKKLLSILTNKLGDPDYKVASKSAHLLTKLVEKHPNMKNIVVAEVERLMYRPNVAQKAQYYAVCFLNQVILDRNETDLAIRLINIYFSFFKAFVKKGDVDSKMLSALLTGVNRAYPYAKLEEEKIAEQMDTLYKIVHIVNFNTSIQALMLLYQVMGSSERTSDRYYQALYSKILDPGLLASSKQAMFLNLLFKSMKKDPVDRRIKAFAKRLLQICCSLPVPFICGALVLLSQVLKEKPSLFQFSQVSQDSDDEDEHFVDIKTEDDDDQHKVTDNEDDSCEDEVLSPEVKQELDVHKALQHQGHTTTRGSWVHKKNLEGTAETGQYDPQHRNPLYARAETECVWELEKLTNHFHPSVALFAKNVLKGQGAQYSGDPLEDFTLIRFLDRFVFRNPKKREIAKGDKGITKHLLQSRSRGKIGKGAKSLAINSEEYLQMDETDIPVDEKFFYKYFSKQASKKKPEEEIDSDVDDDEFDSFLDKYENDGSDFQFDFAGEFSKKEVKDKKKKGEESDSEDSDDFGEDDDLSAEEIGFSDDEDMMAAFDEDSDDDMEGDFDEEAVAFSDDGMDEFAPAGGSKRKANKDEDDVFLDGPPTSWKKNKKSKEFDTSSLFAAAEEFSNIMDEGSSTKLSDIGTEALSNKDNADAKQLSWEMNRDKWVKGQDWKSKKRQRGPKQGGFKGKGHRQNKGKPKAQNRGRNKQRKR